MTHPFEDPEANVTEGPANDDVSVLLSQVHEGASGAQERLFEVIYGRLRQLANGLMRSERPDHTLQATSLVNEACMKMLEQGVIETVESRRYLFAAAVQAMQRILIDYARSRNAKKRGGDRQRVAFDIVLDQFEEKHSIKFTDMEWALQKLKKQSERQYQVLTLRFFAGMSIAETAEIIGCGASTVESDWRWARAKLHSWLSPD